MKNCTDCKYAYWKKTEAGKLHPSGDGKCTHKFEMPRLPPCMYWLSAIPIPHGGHINRRKELSTHCIYFAKKA